MKYNRIIIVLCLVLAGCNLHAQEATKQLPSVFFYYADWCPYCKAMIPAIKAAQDKYQNKVQFRWVDLNTEEGQAIAAKYRTRDGGIPYFQFYDATEALVGDALGAISPETLDSAVAQVLAQQAVENAKQ